MTMPDINRQEPDYDRLLNLSTLTTWTLDRQQQHAADARAYAAALAAFGALRGQVVAGDGRWSAGRRARKVEKHLRVMVEASQKAEAAAHGLRTAYVGHVAHVKALPAQREAKALRKAGRRTALGELAAKSLHKTAAAAVAPAQDSAPPAPAAGQQQARGINELWRRGA